jgi:hypothetical protein
MWIGSVVWDVIFLGDLACEGEGEIADKEHVEVGLEVQERWEVDGFGDKASADDGYREADWMVAVLGGLEIA